MTLSVAMITKDAERTLSQTLSALRGLADEIVVVDSGSSDQTCTIAARAGARLIVHPWMGFGAQKNLAIDSCTCDWVLLLDADEELDLSLILEIKKATAASPAQRAAVEQGGKLPVYLLNRRVRAFGRALDLYDRVPRLFPKGAARLDDRPVHESLIFDPQQFELKALSGFLWHDTYSDLSSYFQKFDRYTSLGAEALRTSGQSFSSIAAVSRSLFRFLRLYFGKGLVLNGWVGFQYAVLGSFYTFVKYAKLRERGGR
jgi:glycosyltransferase involved in cell wall biosynthesis